MIASKSLPKNGSYFQSRHSVTAVVLLRISRSLPKNGTIRHIVIRSPYPEYNSRLQHIFWLLWLQGYILYSNLGPGLPFRRYAKFSRPIILRLPILKFNVHVSSSISWKAHLEVVLWDTCKPVTYYNYIFLETLFCKVWRWTRLEWRHLQGFLDEVLPPDESSCS